VLQPASSLLLQLAKHNRCNAMIANAARGSEAIKQTSWSAGLGCKATKQTSLNRKRSWTIIATRVQPLLKQAAALQQHFIAVHVEHC
jgi:hypothetical protein